MSHPTARLARSNVMFRWASSLFLTVCAAVLCAADNVTDGHTPAGMAPGAPAGSYSLSGFDTVNFFNGNLNFSLSLLKVGGRGSSGHVINLRLERKWFVFQGPYNFTAHTGGWQSLRDGYGAGTLEGRVVGLLEECNPDDTAETLLRLTFTAPDGTEYELRDAAMDGAPGLTAYGAYCSVTYSTPRGRIFKTSDGTSATFVSDVDVTDANGEGIFPSGYMMLRDGTRFRIAQGKVAWARDRNGNLTTFTYTGHLLTQVTDSLGRTVTISYHTPNQAYDQISYTGFGGAQRTVKVHYAQMNTVLRGGSGYQIQTMRQLFPQLLGTSTTTPFDPEVISSVELPDQTRHYRFKYNPYGELARVELPTGGAFEYDWGAGRGGDPASGVMTNLGSQIYRRLLERRIYPDGATGGTYASRMTVSRPEDYWGGNAGFVAIEQRDSSGALLTREEHYFHGSAVSSMGRDAAQYSRWREGRESETRLFDIVAGSAVLRRVMQSTWQQPAAGQQWPLTQAESSEEARPNDPQVTEALTTLSDTNQVSKQTFAYDRYSNQTDVWEYDYGAGQPGPLVRRSQTAYLTTNPVNSADYASPTPTSASIHLRSLPSRESVYDAANNEVARTAYEYDNYSAQPGGIPLARAGITGLCDTINQQNQCVLSNPTLFTVRGNQTAVTRYADAAAQAGAVTTRAHYDVAGNVVRGIDARGNATTTDYGDSFCNGSACGGTYTPYTFAFATSTASPVPDATGQYGSQYGLTTSVVYDFWTGSVTSVTDANGKTTTAQYNDPSGLDRLKAVVRPDTGRTDFEYGDVVGSLYLRTLTDLDQGRRLESKQYFDGLGRSVRSFSYDPQEQSAQWLTTDTQYDALGRAWRTSLPYRSAGPGSPVNPSGKWSETTFDALGRATRAKSTADAAFVSTAYSGNLVTVTDQDGKTRSSRTDALGRLYEVTEAPGVSGYGYITSYQYDALGNLRKVDQGGQHRYFMYDSLSRLVRAKHPEQAANGALALTDAATGNSQWSLGYAYDANGNLTSKTDARSVNTTYAYDAINRNVSVSYSDGTMGVGRAYDKTANGVGRLSWDWTYGTAGVYGAHDIYNYDVAGRVASKAQYFWANGGWGQPYTTSYSHDLAGNVTAVVYPSGRRVDYSYDAAGRLADSGGYAAVRGTLGDGVQRTYASEVKYHELGGRQQERFGTATGVYNKSFYNVRGQLSEIRVSTHSLLSQGQETNWNRGAIINHYSNQTWAGSGTDNNGNLRKQDVYVPNDDQISGYWVRSQFYYYDALNRLDLVSESGAQGWQQDYEYDRWGNRTINKANTWGGAPEPAFEVDPVAKDNRLKVPSGYNGVMAYDNAGNLTTDTYTGLGTRTYDAENRMVTAQDSYGSASYSYDADGRRVRRNVAGGEVWQVYGAGGELLAEYVQGAPASSPRKEYGYRGGELLVQASAPTSAGTGLTGRYYDNADFTGLKLTRTDSAVNFDWGGGSPHSSIGADSYTVRWEGKVEPLYTQTYTFYTQTDDGVRLWVNGQLLIDKWVDQGTTEWSGQIALVAGQLYDIRMDYYENGGGAVAKLLWESFGQPKQAIPQGQLYPTTAGAAQVELKWVVNDQLGTPRMLIGESGSLSSVERHDYLPFGEDLYAGGRSPQQGYAGDSSRRKFTGYERDGETGLDYAQARYFSSAQGRFTGVDPLHASGVAADPQTWNRYSYGLNSPLKYTDPSGMLSMSMTSAMGQFAPNHESRNGVGGGGGALTGGNYCDSGCQEKREQQQQKEQQQTLAAQVKELNSKATALKPGEQAVPTTMVYLQGEAKTYTGQQLTLPDGTVVIAGPVYGIIQTNAIVVLDQGGNVMGDQSGLKLLELVRPDSPDARAAMQAGDLKTTNNRPVLQHKDGLFYDHVKVTDGTAAASRQRFSQPFDVQVKQRLYLHGPGGGGALVYMDNVHRITNSGITSTIGKAKPWPR